MTALSKFCRHIQSSGSSNLLLQAGEADADLASLVRHLTLDALAGFRSR